MNFAVNAPLFMQPFRDTFQKSAIKDLKKFAKQFSGVSKWLLISDYVFDGRAAINDVATFVLFPYIYELEEFMAEIGRAQSLDIKHTHTVSNRLLRLLKRTNFLPIICNIDKGLSLVPGKQDGSAITDILNSWRVACGFFAVEADELTSASQYTDAAGLLQTVQNEISAYPTTKISLLRQFVVVVNIASYLSAILHDNASATDVCWFTDRDPMLGHVCGNDYQRFAPEIFYVCTRAFLENATCFSPAYVIPQASGKMWYDSLVRIADYFAGTFSRLDPSATQQDRALQKLLYRYVVNKSVIALKITEKDVARYDFSLA